MPGWDTGASSHLIRSEIWSTELKDVLLDDLNATSYVRWLSEFPDGDQFTIPSVGAMNVRDYNENDAVIYDKMDTGEFTFSIDEYVSSATYITKKAMQDQFYMNELVSSFVPKQRRAIEEKLETDIWAKGNAGQTASDLNAINGGAHRFVAAAADESMGVADFARALYGLKKANVPGDNLIAIVDPSVEYTLNTLSNLTSVANNPRWEGVIESGIAKGMKFVKNVYGFDVYTSNYLADIGAETIDSHAVADGVGNVFFSASSDVTPIVGAWRQMPEVDSEYNKDLQREEYVTTARYGLKLYRPENYVTCITDTTVAS